MKTKMIAILTTVLAMGVATPCSAAIPGMTPLADSTSKVQTAEAPSDSAQEEVPGDILYETQDGGYNEDWDQDDDEEVEMGEALSDDEALSEIAWSMPKEYVDHGIPVMSITLNGTTLATINAGPKSDRYPGNHVRIYQTEQVILDSGDLEIKGRGNSTWRGVKKPYQIKFEKKTNLFGMGAAKKWVLLANLTDSSQLRNEAALSIAEKIGLKYSFNGEFIDLYVDGEYIGMYYLTHKVEIGENVVNLEAPDGVLMENDTIHENTDPRHISMIEGQYLYLKEVNDETLQDSALQSFSRAYDRFEADCYNGDWPAVSSEIDVVSFAKYYLLSEFTANPDANHSSFFMYRDGEDDIIHAGPAWDFDLSFGRNGAGYYYDPHRIWIYNDTYNVPERTSLIFSRLLDIPEFRNVVEVVYCNVMQGAIIQELQELQEKAAQIREAAYADNEKWDKKDFDTCVSELLKWIQDRKEFFDLYFSGARTSFAHGQYVISCDEGMVSAEYGSNLVHLSQYLPADTRLFSLSQGKNGFYTLTNEGEGKVLYDNNKAKNTDANLRQDKISEASADGSQWLIIRNKDESYTIFSKNSNLALTREGGELYTRPWTGGNDQCFRIVKVENQDQQITEFLQRLYRGCLGRDADKEGLDSWKAALYKGSLGTEVAVGFLHSREFANLNLDNEEFINALYVTIFNREADDPGMKAWLGVLASGATRAKLLEGFLNSREMCSMCEMMGVPAGVYQSMDIRDLNFGVTSYVARLYRNCIGREYDEEGLLSWVDALVNGRATGSQTAMGFFFSKEMKNQALSDRDFVAVAYRTMLDREPDQDGLQAWVKALDQGFTREEILSRFAGSREFSGICEYYGIER